MGSGGRWHEANAGLPAPPLGTEREAWNARDWSPVIGREHRAVRERAGLFDLATFTKIEVSGPGALPALHRICATDLDRPIGRATYALLLDDRGGIESDLTVTRLAEDRFLMLCGSGSGPRDLARVRLLTRDCPGVQIYDVTSAWCGLGLWGPAAPEILAALRRASDVRRRAPLSGPAAVLRRRRRLGAACPDRIRWIALGELWRAGRPHGFVAAGGGAMDSLRLERGFRALGTDLRGEFMPREAGLGFAVSKARSDFVGRMALAERPAIHRLVCLVLDNPTVVLVGKEPILAGDEVVDWVTSANFGYTVGRSVAFGYVP